MRGLINHGKAKDTFPKTLFMRMDDHIDLFSGIAASHARQVWGDEYENVLFCDNNKF